MASKTGLQYSWDQVKQIWIQNGGNPQQADMAAAVASAESGRRPDEDGHAGRGTDYGLWQINSMHGADASWHDPNKNAKSAIELSNNGATWRPWCVAYSDAWCGQKGGSYGQGPAWKLLADHAANPNASGWGGSNGATVPGGGQGFVPGLPGLPNPLDMINSAIANAAATVIGPLVKRGWWTLEVMGGGAMIVVGLFLLFLSAGGGKHVGKIAPVVAPGVPGKAIGAIT